MSSKTYTEVKVGNYEGRLEELTKKYSGKFTKIPLGDSFVQKYGLVKPENGSNYIIIVSQGPVTPANGYNIILSVIGPNQERVKQLMREFETNFGIEMRTSPKFLEDIFEKLPDMLNRSSPSNNSPSNN